MEENSRVISIKERVRNYIDMIYFSSKEEIKDILVCSLSQKIGLWKMQLVSGEELYFYTNIRGEILFGGECFSYATPFSNCCAIVGFGTSKFYILNIKRNELAEISNDKMEIQNVRGIKNRSITVLANGYWGSYHFDEDENILQEEVPFIWDVLDFTEDGKNAYVGIFSFKEIKDEQKDNWPMNDYLLQLRIAFLGKENVKDYRIYQKFLRESYANSDNNCFIEKRVKKLSSDIRMKYAYSAYDIDGLYKNSEKPLFMPGARDAVETGNIEDYKVVLARLK